MLIDVTLGWDPHENSRRPHILLVLYFYVRMYRRNTYHHERRLGWWTRGCDGTCHRSPGFPAGVA